MTHVAFLPPLPPSTNARIVAHRLLCAQTALKATIAALEGEKSKLDGEKVKLAGDLATLQVWKGTASWLCLWSDRGLDLGVLLQSYVVLRVFV